MSEVLSRIKAKYPEAYANVPDRELALAIGKRYPAYLIDSEFHAEFSRYERGEQLRQQRDMLGREPEATVFGQFKEIAGDVGALAVEAAAETLASIPEFAGRTAQALERKFGAAPFGPSGVGENGEDLLTLRAARAIRKGAASLVGEIDPEQRKEFFLGKVPQAVGSTAGFFLGGLTGKAAKISPWVTVATLGAAAGGAEGFRRAKLAGADDETAFLALTGNAVLGTTEAFPLAQILNRINKATGNTLARALIEGTTEALQEVAQTLGGNAIQSALTDDDVALMSEVVENGAAGKLTGFFLSLLTSVIGRRVAGSTSAETQEPPQASKIAVERIDEMGQPIPEAPTPDALDPVTVAAVSSLRPGPEALSLPPELRRPNEITLAESPKAEAPEGAVNFSAEGVSFEHLAPKQIILDATEATRNVVERIQAAQQRRAELQTPKLETSGQEFSGQERVPGFLQSAEDRIIARDFPLAPLAPVEEIAVSTPLQTVQEKVEQKLANRDLVGAVSMLGQARTEISRKVVENIFSMKRERVPLAAGERLIFQETWAQVLAKKLQEKKPVTMAEAIEEIEREPVQIVPPVKSAPLIRRLEDHISEIEVTEGKRPAIEVKAELVQKLETALATAPEAESAPSKEPGTVTIEIPGDGEFTIVNTRQAIKQVLKRAKRLYVSSVDPDPAAAMERQRRKVESERRAASSQTLGIIPPGAQILQRFIDRYAPALAENDPPAVNFDTSTVAPDFQPYSVSQEVATRPHGLGRIRGLGWIFDPRARNNTPTERAIITRAFEMTIGKAVATSLGYSLGGNVDEAFMVEDGRITNVQTTTEDAPLHISDFFEQLQQNPSDYNLTPEQQEAANRALSVLREIQQLQRRNGISPSLVEDEREAPLAGEVYFPRIVIGDRTEQGAVEPLDRKRQGKGTAIGAKQGFQKSRTFKTEWGGAEYGKVYEPSIEKRLVTHLARTYRAIADKRLAENPELGGETMAERKQRYLAAFATDIKEGRITEADVQNIASSLRDDERFVFSPAFAGKVFPAEVGDVLNSIYGESASSFRRTLADANNALKGLGFGLDFAAPFLQGQALMFSEPKLWAKATANSMRAFLDRGVMQRYGQNPENQSAMRELAQLGVPLGTLQDFMAGLQQEGALTRLPVAGKVFEAFGRSFESFTEIATVEMWKAYRDVTPRNQWPAVAETIQNTLLRGRMEEIGVTPQRALLERAILLAPSYHRGGFNIIASINASGVSGRIARRALGAWMLGGTLSVTGILLALGYDWDEIEERLNPWSADFLTVPVKFDDGRTRNFGLGGSIRSLVRLIGEISESVVKNDGRITSFGQNNPVIRWFRGKLAPVPRIVSDTWLGTDFLGNEVTARSLLVSVTPLASQRLWMTRPGEPPIDAGDVLPSILGLQIWPEPLQRQFNRERNDAAKALGFNSYEAAPLSDQVHITRQMQARPEFVKPEPTQRQKELALRADEERINRIREHLSDDLSKVMSNLNPKVVGYEPVLHFGKGVDLPLSQKQQERYEELIIEAYNEVLPQLPWETLAKHEPTQRQEILNKVMGSAKQAARGRLLREMVNGAGKPSAPQNQ
jgi:hypothetical protein